MTTSPTPAAQPPAPPRGEPATSPRTVTLLRGEPGENGPLYTRLLATSPDGPHGGMLLLTAEVYREVGSTGPVFPILRSVDGGMSWDLVAQVADTRYGAGHRYQPMLFELPRPFAGLAAGTLLLAGSSIPADMSSTRLVVYASTDGGTTWTFLSEVDAGGPAEYDWRDTAETTAIWEPCLDLVGDQLVCYYADERRKADRMLQVLVHRTSRDLREWSEPVLDFGVPDRRTRPGMFVTAGRMPDGLFRAVIEVVGPREVPVHLVASEDGLDWGPPSDLGARLVGVDGTALSGTPNIHWRTVEDGRTVVVATGRHTIDADGTESNKALVNLTGGTGPWYAFDLPTPAERRLADDASGYSQTLLWNSVGRLVQATTVRNDVGSHDIVVTVADEPDWWAADRHARRS